MKDLRFIGHLTGSFNGHFIVGITFRTDITTTTPVAGTNFTVLETRLDNQNLKDEHEEFFGVGFKQLPTNLKAFIDFANTNNLDLEIQDSNGANRSKLVNESSRSESGFN